MIKKIGFLLFNVLLFVIAKSQNTEPLIYSVVYDFIHINDLSDKNNPLKNEMLLEIGLSKSKYGNYFHQKKIKESKKQNLAPNRLTGMKVTNGMPLAIVNSEKNNSEAFVQIPSQGKLYRYEELAMEVYKVESKLSPIYWILTPEIKIIQGYSCQMAKGSFAGRDYIAWFSVSLPFNFGPWKLWGLPGLILEAYDSKGEVKFLCKEIIRNIYKDEVIFIDPDRSIRIDEEKLQKAKLRFYNDPIGMTNASINDKNNGNVELIYVEPDGKILKGEEAKDKIKRRIPSSNYNPLELFHY